LILKLAATFRSQKVTSPDALHRAMGRGLSFEIKTFAIKKIAVAIALTSGCVLSGAYMGLAHAAPAANALPSGGQVAAGSASIATNGSTMTVTQSSQRAVVNWNSFDVGSGAKVEFKQRVTGPKRGMTAEAMVEMLIRLRQKYQAEPHEVLPWPSERPTSAASSARCWASWWACHGGGLNL
jgi:hypothetical protein